MKSKSHPHHSLVESHVASLGSSSILGILGLIVGLMIILPGLGIAQSDAGTLDRTHYIPPFYAASNVQTQFLALSTPELDPFDVTLATADGLLETYTISRNSPVIVNLSSVPEGGAGYAALGLVNEDGLNVVNNSDGLILTGEQRFYANIRHSHSFQGTSLTAKGRSGLGKRFRSGHMITGSASESGDSRRSHFISVIASEDNTMVELSDVTPGVVFREGGGPFTGVPGPFALDRGESFVVGVYLVDVEAQHHNDLNGTLLTSNKPVVVNTGSWLASNSSGHDIGTDQILPTSLLGTDFILAKGNATSRTDVLEVPIVVADSDNTQVFVNGAATPLATLNSGEYLPISGSNYTSTDTLLIRTSQPASIYQSTAGSNSGANVGMNFVVAISDSIEPQEVVVPSVNQLGTATVDVIAPAGAPVDFNGSPLSGAMAIDGTSDFEIYSFTATGDITIDSPEALFVSITTASGVRTTAAYFSGVPNSLAVDDSALTAFETPVSIDVQANDVADSIVFSIVSTSSPANGAVVINGDGTVTYTPDTGFSGEDSFDYTISDGAGSSDTATVTITVVPNTYNFAVASESVLELDAAHTYSGIEILRDGDLSITGSIDVELFAGAGDPATPGVDFGIGPITVSFGVGESVGVVPIEILGDTDIEPSESVSLALSGMGVGSTQPTADLTIIDDDQPLADISVSVTESADPIQPASALEYRVTIENAGPDAATGVVIEVDLGLPLGVNVESASASTGSVAPGFGFDYEWTVALEVGESATLTVGLTASESALPGVDAISISAELGDLDQIDTDPSNDQDSEATSIEEESIGDFCGDASPDGLGCCVDAFDDEDLGSWQVDDLGNATGSTAQEIGDVLQLTGTGTELYHGDDNGAFAHQSVSGDFRVEVDVTNVPVDLGGIRRKAGLIVRTSTATDAPRVMVTYVPHFPDPAQPDTPSLMFDYRDENGTALELGSTVVGVTLPVRLAIQRVADELSVYFSRDGGQSWVKPAGGAGGSIDIPMGDEILAGMVVSSYDAAQPMTASFDDFGLCRPIDEGPTPSTNPCDPTQARDVILLLDASGSMTRAHGNDPAGASKLKSVAAALTQLSASMAAQNDGSRAALVTYRGSNDAADNVANGVWVTTGFTDDFDALASAIAAEASASIDPRSSSPASLALYQVLELLVGKRDPSHDAVMIWATDSLPNVDGAGDGPSSYTDAELQSLALTDTLGNYLAPGLVGTRFGGLAGQLQYLHRHLRRSGRGRCYARRDRFTGRARPAYLLLGATG